MSQGTILSDVVARVQRELLEDTLEELRALSLMRGSYSPYVHGGPEDAAPQEEAARGETNE